MEQKKSVLVVLEDSKLAQLVIGCLITNYSITHIQRVDKAFSKLEEKHFDLIILHTNNNSGNSIELCIRTKLETESKVIFLSNNENILLKERCFENGADDYIMMPFFPKELTMRIKRLLNEYEIGRNSCIETKGLLLNSFNRTIKYNSCTVFLSPTEFILMEYMIKQDRYHKPEGLINHLSRMKNKELSNAAIIVLIKRLRLKFNKGIGMDIIKSRYGLGYYLSL